MHFFVISFIFINMRLTFDKLNEELRIAWGMVYPEAFPDAHAEVMLEEDIRDAAYNFMVNGLSANVDTMHDKTKNGAYVVESFIAREGDPDFPAGSWVVAIYFPDDPLWNRVKSGELAGISMSGGGIREPGIIEIEVPEVIRGVTREAEGHFHSYEVRYNPKLNKFIGVTLPDETGHIHDIVNNLNTEDSDNHKHLVSILESL